MEKDVIIIIDGNSLMHRAFYALPPLTNKDGLHTNVIFGFVNMINKLIELYKPKYIAIAFDRKEPTFRHKEYAEYKAKRLKMSEDMAEQIPYLKKVIDAMNIKRLELEGYEADDIIGTLSKMSDRENIKTLIVTGDRDAFQLITDNVHVLMTKKGISEMEEYDRDKLLERYSISPEQVIDLKGLMGDASDNIPGIPGVGEKTALELLKQFGTIENILENTDNIKKNKIRENVENNRDMALLSKRLATIITDAPLDVHIKDCEYEEPDYESLAQLYEMLEFKSFLQKIKAVHLKSQDNQVNVDADIDVSEINDSMALKGLMSKILQEKKITFKISQDDNGSPDYVFIAVQSQYFYIPINGAAIDFLKDVMENANIEKAGHDIKSDILILKTIGINIESIIFDSMIAAYLLNPSKPDYKLKSIYNEFFGNIINDYESKEGDKVKNYGNSLKAIDELMKPMMDKIREMGMESLYKDVELPLAEVLADMEHEGFKVDKDRLRELSALYSERIDKLTQEIYELAGEEFNINSTKQLSVILFEKLSLPPVKKTKTGYSTDVEVLEKLSDKHPIIDKILEYRQLLKIKSTYVDGFINIINEKTGKVHSKFNQTVTATGRLSSTEPNLQNIPVKTENGREIRKVFVPKNEDYVLVDADYSQIELRVLAHISGDESLIQSFIYNEDIHTRTASEVFGVDKELVSPLMRSRAKAVNFGIVYGISDFGLARDLKIPKKEAKLYIDNYFARYPMVKKYMDDIVKEGKEKGYVTTILNRIRYIPELSSANAVQRSFGERIAMNTPIQGSAADIIKIAMVRVYKELKNRKMKSKLILQVHDELIVEAHKDEVEEVKKIVKEKMETAFDLKVPLIVDINVGMSWYETK
ncbi:DNA polymerase I [Lutispora thermophila]|uniref:DNA polymerase I n=1 Tax=Lutispora thermophila DSM 19022 TaxID=1122184 RepID=A0A1M6FQP9_9FIRM|nr:DNA polymerase I [Lutispora thermophila]SHJ00020.1 DNA polymerase I [Lutispora thermophila DSM 19022]